MEQISVSFASIIGKIKPMHSVNNGPAGAKVRGTSNFDTYAAAGIPLARNHDASFYSGYGGEHTVDVHRIFKNFDADENDPASYCFGPTDHYLQNIIDAGTGVYYRLGASIEHGYKFGTYPPKDFAKWARICEHIIRHYNEGWADGFHYNIRYWEIWNEPDCRNADGSNPCWQGTPEQFTDLFVITVRHLKTCFPDLKIGGPALCSNWNDAWNKRIFDAVKKENLPFDFFSFHGYTRYPADYQAQALKARRDLDAYGFTDTEIILNEWNYIKGWLNEDWKYSLRMEKSLKGASFIIASMICAQDSPMDHFMYYDARPCGMCGMFDTDTLQPLKGYYAFPMFSTLYQIGEEAEAPMRTDDTIYTLAAAGENKCAVLLTHYSDNDETAGKDVKLSLTGLPEGVWKIGYHLLDAEHDNELVREERIANTAMDAYLYIPLFGSVLVTLDKE